MNRRHVALVGMPGAGKSTVGPRLARLLDLPFVEADAEITREAGRSVPEIFAEEGEAGFRRREHATLARLVDGAPAVIATGGGAFAEPATRALLQERAATVWLHTALDVLSARTAEGGRPLLAGADRHAALEALLQVREPAYRQADARVDASGDPNAIARAVVGALASAPVRIPVGGSRPYPVLVGRGLLDALGERVTALRPVRRAALVTDAHVAALYAERAEAALAGAGVDVVRITIAPGEQAKSWSGLAELCDGLAAGKIGRADTVVALGGGVVGDLAGFAAAVHMRGVDWVQVPTTLLAQVDSSVGGKTAIDTAAGKNLVGAFWPPVLVLADMNVLASLPERERRAGYAEVVKYGLLGGPTFFAWLETNGSAVLAGDPAATATAVERCVRLKAEIVGEDERESAGGRRALLNLGHTFGHALEAQTGFALLHGEAVALGCAMAARFSGPGAEPERVEAHLRASGLPTRLSDLPSRPSAEALLARMAGDKKRTGDGLTLVLLDAIGAAAVRTGVDPERVLRFLREEGAA